MTNRSISKIFTLCSIAANLFGLGAWFPCFPAAAQQSPQTLEIQFINGSDGSPLHNVGIIGLDCKGTHEQCGKRMYSNMFDKIANSKSEGVVVVELPAAPDHLTLDIAGGDAEDQARRTCASRPPKPEWASHEDVLHQNFSVAEIMKTGIVGHNTECNRSITALPQPGVIKVFFRPLSWIERLFLPPQM
jgi:hypothetical protein